MAVFCSAQQAFWNFPTPEIPWLIVHKMHQPSVVINFFSIEGDACSGAQTVRSDQHTRVLHCIEIIRAVSHQVCRKDCLACFVSHFSPQSLLVSSLRPLTSIPPVPFPPPVPHYLFSCTSTMYNPYFHACPSYLASCSFLLSE